ncbi:DUF4192 domain-containing protein [Nocardioides sp. PD653]|uniref:DUF4192 domain-containing protein n=1 Tax=Nocardioides sp. PD653 TaxID=393303 RepID=UPI0009EFDEEA|nr:DUF4192 domain-containing protein [Nocardioides sp. PD653]GAW54767.1 uncharacterized protein PD653_2181 [Nocardioides sp. PD653]
MNDVLTLRSHDEVISYIPHILGFRDPQGMVCLPMGGGPIARLDIPDSPEANEAFLDALAETYLHRHPTRRMVLVAFGEDQKACVDALSALSARLVSDPRGPDVGPVLWVNGEEWFDVLEGTSGTVDPSERRRVDAQFALMGRAMPVSSRDALAAAMQGDPAGVAEHLPAAEDRVLGMGLSARTAEVTWLDSRLDEFLETQERLSDVDAARVLAIVHDTGARDAAIFKLTRETAPVFSDFWQDLVRRAPSDVRDGPATLLALSAYVKGDGAKAWTALEQLVEHDTLADLVTDALEKSIHPETIARTIQAAKAARTPGSTGLQQAALQSPITRAQDRPENNGPGLGTAGPGTTPPSR